MAASSKPKPLILDNIDEEYYPISPEILASFPKFRPPVDFFRFNEKIAQLLPYTRKGVRLSTEQVEEVALMCTEDVLFVSRSDLPIYGHHIAKQIELVLLDVNFKPVEVVRLVKAALIIRIEALIDQPVLPVFEALQKDLMVLTELLWKDKHVIKLFMRVLNTGKYNLAEHMLSSIIIGIWYYIYVTSGTDFTRKKLDQLALAFALMNIGMSKIPPFILGKEQNLTIAERGRIDQHTAETLRILNKLDQKAIEILQAASEHHERLDASGPSAKARPVSTVGRVAAIADAFSAMLTERHYAKAQAVTDIMQELLNDRRLDKALVTPLANAYLTKALNAPDVVSVTVDPVPA